MNNKNVDQAIDAVFMGVQLKPLNSTNLSRVQRKLYGLIVYKYRYTIYLSDEFFKAQSIKLISNNTIASTFGEQKIVIISPLAWKEEQEDIRKKYPKFSEMTSTLLHELAHIVVYQKYCPNITSTLHHASKSFQKNPEKFIKKWDKQTHNTIFRIAYTELTNKYSIDLGVPKELLLNYISEKNKNKYFSRRIEQGFKSLFDDTISKIVVE